MELNNNVYMCMFLLVIILFIFMYRHNLKKESFSDTEYVQVYGRRARMGEPCPPLRKSECQQNDGNKHHCLQSYSASSNHGNRFCKWESDAKTCRATDDRCSPREESPAQEIESFTNSTEYVQVNGRRARTGDPCPPLRRSECQENNGNRSNCLRSYSSGRNGNRFCQWKPGKNQCKTTGEICNVPPPPPPPPRVGCMIRGYDNYDSKANKQGNCLKKGCMIRGYDNYDSKANQQGNCIKKGCMTRGYDNYDSKANQQGNCIKKGCTTRGYDNYDSKANVNDGSCIKKGCMTRGSDNYDSKANVNDGSCYITGCMDKDADNYNTKATRQGPCTITGCMDKDAENYNSRANKKGKCTIKGCMDKDAENYNPKANKKGNCSIKGCMDKDAKNYISKANIEDNSCEYFRYGCMKPDASNYDKDAQKSDGYCIYKGCTNPLATNYDKKANIDDNSCRIVGCTDTTAKNYSAIANVDDGTCKYVKYGCTDKTAVNYDKTAEKSLNSNCIWPPPARPVLPPPPPIPKSLEFKKDNCEIKYETGFCVMNNDVAAKNKHKIDDLDFGLQSADRNIECYQKAKDKYGNNLTGVEIISNNENSGCYAHTSDKIFKANALKNHICHISEKHYVSQYCDPVSVDKGDIECEAIIQRKQQLNDEQSESNDRLRRENKQLNILLKGYRARAKRAQRALPKSDLSILTKKLQERYVLLDAKRAEDAQDYDNRGCSNTNSMKLQEIENEKYSLLKDYERLKLENEDMRNEANSHEIISLEHNSETKSAEYRKQIQKQELQHAKDRAKIQRLLDSKLVKEKREAEKQENERKKKYLAEQKRRLAEIAIIEEQKRQKEEEIQNRKKLLAQERVKSLQEAEKIAKTKEQKEALQYAKQNAINYLKQLDNDLKDMIKKHTKERLSLEATIEDIKYKQNVCKDDISQVEGAKGKGDDDLQKCSLFTRQMQRIEPVFF